MFTLYEGLGASVAIRGVLHINGVFSVYGLSAILASGEVFIEAVLAINFSISICEDIIFFYSVSATSAIISIFFEVWVVMIFEDMAINLAVFVWEFVCFEEG